MDRDFYKDARKWYNTVYVNPASERLMYFAIFVISCACLYQCFGIIKRTKEIKDFKHTYVIFTNNKEKDSFIKVRQISSQKDQVISLLEEIITRYVVNMETLTYKSSQSGIDAIRSKTIKIKNLSGKEVYDKYVENTYKNENGDMSLSILKLQKTSVVKKIEFLYEDINMFEKIYSSLLSVNIPKGAKVYFSTETTDEKQKKENFIATMNFSFYIDPARKAKTVIDFKVNDYYVEKDNTVETEE